MAGFPGPPGLVPVANFNIQTNAFGPLNRQTHAFGVLDFHDNVLTLQGERKSEFKEEKEGYYHAERSLGTFRRDIPFDDEVNSEKVKAKLKNGTLHIELLKKENSKKTHKKIEIKH